MYPSFRFEHSTHLRDTVTVSLACLSTVDDYEGTLPNFSNRGSSGRRLSTTKTIMQKLRQQVEAKSGVPFSEVEHACQANIYKTLSAHTDCHSLLTAFYERVDADET